MLEEAVLHLSIRSVTYGAVVIGVVILLAILLQRTSGETLKQVLFWLISGTAIFVTTLLLFSTVYLNQNSATKGPVHWHADFEIWACGQKLDLVDPVGISNKVGTNTLHEHNDDRIHVEGVVVNLEDANLGRFFNVIGGLLTDKTLIIPTVEGRKEFINGQKCDSDRSVVQVFAYNVREGKIVQTKLSDPAAYQMTPTSTIPPGDCIIVEFAQDKPRTDRLCTSYRAAIERGDL